jgi:hypothetical protein
MVGTYQMGGDEEVTKPSEATKIEGPAILTSSFLLNWSFVGQGWESTRWEDEEVTKSFEPYYAAYGWESNQHKNYETNKLQNNSP